jgi:hypothetical protein
MKNNQLFEFNFKPDKKHILEIGKHKFKNRIKNYYRSYFNKLSFIGIFLMKNCFCILTNYRRKAQKTSTISRTNFNKNLNITITE